ncbi:MAG: cadherin-like beta sandwich domain-containing protein [Dysgonamonadaceae bacterium]|jgi:hypothetical protein|nr:cadherin-like beta sandwich domain-containing protein [Dysgonamonadaceae bacterium]
MTTVSDLYVCFYRLTTDVRISTEADFPEHGENVFNIGTTNNYNRTRTYTLKINRRQNPNRQLQSLNCYPHYISPAYSLNTHDYTLRAGKSVESISINATPISLATVSGQTGTQKLNHGRNLFTFTVTTLDMESSTYTLEVWCEELDTNAALSYLTVNPGYIRLAFSPDTTSSYTAEVENGFNFLVFSEAGSRHKIYSLTVTRKDNMTNTAQITRDMPAVSIRNGIIETDTPVAE